LRALDRQIARALPSVTDEATRRHLQDARETITTTLDPRAMRERGATVVAGGRGQGAASSGGSSILGTDGAYDFDQDPFLSASDACWPDLRID
jgi:hypothetical protein